MADGQPFLPHSADRLTLERGGQPGWCGPAAIALATGCGYARACELLRHVAPDRYAGQRDIVTAYWRDVVAAVRLGGLPAEPLPVRPKATPRRLAAQALVSLAPVPRPPTPRGPTLLALARRGGLEPGLYLVRVTGHFLLLTLHGFGLAQVHDNRLCGAALSAHSHGRCRVTHLARLLAA
ncbi:MAG: hypothetical protein JWP20_2508 [Roseomonas sp.]|jgi:hypothetical protein|nr:hypothetical protein [Roseomonas sp.]